jgi:hypothetical protein
LAHATGELTWPPVYRVAETDQPKIALRLIFLLGARPLRMSGVDGKPDVLDRREPRQQRVILEDD